MNIEIKGVNFNNKGAELMLHAIVKVVSKKFPEAKLVIAPSRDTYIERTKLNLYQKLSVTIKEYDYGRFIDSFLPLKLKNIFGLVSENEIDLVLDASGLAYSDQWGVTATKTSAIQFKRMKRGGSKIILLPQAFGPFRNKQIQNQFKRLCDSTDLIFARDRVSYEHIISILGNSKKEVFIYPDFTNLAEGRAPDQLEVIEGKICIIPNYRMIDKVSNSKNYLPFLIQTINLLRESGNEVFILIHSGELDLKLANEINNSFNNEITIINENDPLKIKGIIGSSKGVISSRYHGLVSALSQGVPALGTGWNHKYEMLFEDYNFSDGLLDIDYSIDKLTNKLEWLTEEKKFKNLVEILSESSAKEKRKTLEMWELVWAKIL